MGFQIVMDITSENQSEMLVVATWLKNNYGGKIHHAQGRSNNFNTHCIIVETTFTNMVDTITALVNEYGPRITWFYQMEELI